MSIESELNKRRTFAIISHPDAGKTTLTEKFLLYGGAIQTAGAVKSNKIKKSATSDFMEIEKQRGISVATSVMSFEYQNTLVNLLDTPGHKDFAEDTYRTLTAVDSVILVVDCVKGVEIQTEKLMEVCSMRKTPVIVFINKLDRDGKDPFDLLDELEQKLKIRVRPLSWPIGGGKLFKGVYNIFDKNLNLFRASGTSVEEEYVSINDIADGELDTQIGEKEANKLREDVELIDGVYEPFDVHQYLEGNVAPVFFGSAVNNFGVRELLEAFIRISPIPRSRNTESRIIQPTEPKFTGFIFKIHANIDPNHRSRIAFLRVCSGKFERNKFYYHTRSDKNMRFSNPVTFMASDKSIVEDAYAGDVIGLNDTGNFKIGDTLSEGEKIVFKGIPSFSPEIFKELVNTDPMKTKQLEKGILQLMEEGVAQLFTTHQTNAKIIGTVGDLQFEVIQYRLLHEYGASCTFKPMQYYKAFWITADDAQEIKNFIRTKSNYIAFDIDQQPVFLASSEWIYKLTQQDYPKITFHTTSEFSKDEVINQ
ncbi:MAG: peptide chain release factor 3 [Sphingobacteriales bacterium]|jgi:peptide chain release factor 3|nr:MAG: peptide chain release factor 3 [Sphingobacteriales bacterium]